MNWIERMYELKGKDPYSQGGEGIYLEYLWHTLAENKRPIMFDIGAGDEFILSNSRHLRHLGFKVRCYEKEYMSRPITLDNCLDSPDHPIIISIDIDGNDYWILNAMLPHYKPEIVISEFNPAFLDSRTIKYNPDHTWDGTEYYGFSFAAGQALAAKHGYKIIFNVNNMNLIMIREDLIRVSIPIVTYEVPKFFEESAFPREWIMI
jgi:hypothetical protein